MSEFGNANGPRTPLPRAELLWAVTRGSNIGGTTPIVWGGNALSRFFLRLKVRVRLLTRGEAAIPKAVKEHLR